MTRSNEASRLGNDAELSRRTFLTRLTTAAGAVVAIVAAVPVIGVALEPLLRRRQDAWRDVGRLEDFTVGETAKVAFEDASARPWAGRTGRTGAWLRRTGNEEFIAFALDCTHLGCPVRWESRAQLYMCPCHGGVYYADGRVAGGPPPQPLRRYPVRVSEGRVEIHTSPLPVT
jgi:menaquinol-cytochrome c reductase iron-sulfur subunit